MNHLHWIEVAPGMFVPRREKVGRTEVYTQQPWVLRGELAQQLADALRRSGTYASTPRVGSLLGREALAAATHKISRAFRDRRNRDGDIAGGEQTETPLEAAQAAAIRLGREDRAKFLAWFKEWDDAVTPGTGEPSVPQEHPPQGVRP